MRPTIAAALTVLAIALAGCGAVTTKAETEASAKCPSIMEGIEGKCKTVKQAEETSHIDAVEKEDHETEAVLKHRQAEDSANAVESATGEASAEEGAG